MGKSFISNTPGPDDQVVMPNFVPEVPGLSDFVAAPPSSQRPQAFIHTPIVGACTVCKQAGSIDLPADFNPKIGDAMLEGRIVKVYCPRCRRTTEFRPLSPDELSENQFLLMRRYYELYKQLMVEGQELPFEVRQFVDAYEKRLQQVKDMLGLGDILPKPKPPEPPKIVTP